MNLPMILGVVIMSVLSGGLVTALGYYTPFMIISSILMGVGGGLIATFETDTNSPRWIGYQAIYGFGVGFGMQQALIAVQAALPYADVPIGTAIIMFSQTLGGALFISVGQNVFNNELVKNVLLKAPNLRPDIILQTGATELKNRIDPELLPGVLEAYNLALVRTFYVAVAIGSLSIIGSVLMPWISVKGKKIETAGAA